MTWRQRLVASVAAASLIRGWAAPYRAVSMRMMAPIGPSDPCNYTGRIVLGHSMCALLRTRIDRQRHPSPLTLTPYLRVGRSLGVEGSFHELGVQQLSGIALVVDYLNIEVKGSPIALLFNGRIAPCLRGQHTER